MYAVVDSRVARCAGKNLDGDLVQYVAEIQTRDHRPSVSLHRPDATR